MMRLPLWIMVIGAFAAGLWFAWPHYEVHALRLAVRHGDAAAIEARIDAPRLAASLRSAGQALQTVQAEDLTGAMLLSYSALAELVGKRPMQRSLHLNGMDQAVLTLTAQSAPPAAAPIRLTLEPDFETWHWRVVAADLPPEALAWAMPLVSASARPAASPPVRAQ